MFSKARYQTFAYYSSLSDQTRWEKDLDGLKESGFSHLVLSQGLDLRTILSVEDQKQNLMAFLDLAHTRQIQCVLGVGNPKELYLAPENKRWRSDYVSHVAEMLGAHPAVYALLLEDAPTGGIQFSLERWKTVTSELEGRLEGVSLTEAGYQYAIKSWQMEQYTVYISELVKAVKKVRSRLKCAISFHYNALFPTDTLVHFQNTARSLDFVLIDAGLIPGTEPVRIRYLPRFLANVTTTLTDCEVWMVADGHIPSGQYDVVLREIREWMQEVCEQGVSAVGWRGWDDPDQSQRSSVQDSSMKVENLEQRTTIQGLSRIIVDRERQKAVSTPYTCLMPYDSFINRLPWLDCVATGVTLGVHGQLALHYVSDSSLVGDEKLQKTRMLFTTPYPSGQSGVADRLMMFMERGGWIVATGSDFLMDEQVQLCATRRRLFGIQQESPRANEDRILISNAGLPYLTDGTSLATAWNRIGLTELDDSVRVLGRWGDGVPAIVLRPLGKGGSLYIGTNPYQAALTRGNAAEWGQFFRSIADSEWVKTQSGGK